MNDKLLKLLIGNLFMLCMLAAIAIVIYFYQSTRVSSDDISNNSIYIEPDDIRITDHHLRGMEGGVLVLGTMENKGKHTWHSISLEAELFDAKGKFVNECNTLVQADLAPDSKENFKLNCANQGDNTFIGIARVKIRVIKASRYNN